MDVERPVVNTLSDMVLDLGKVVRQYFSHEDVAVVMSALHFYMESSDNLNSRNADTVMRVIDILRAVEMVREIKEPTRAPSQLN